MGSLEHLRGKRVLVTGHTGFKGSWLCLALNDLGASVSGLSDAIPTDPSHFAEIGLAQRLDHHVADIRDPIGLERVFRAVQPEVVMHLAAQPLVRLGYEKPAETFHVNVGGTVNVLDAVRQCSSVRAVVVVTSDKCYENHEWDFAYRENDALGGHDPYSASKGATEIVAASYRRSFFEHSGVALATARAGNVIGGGDWGRDRLVPDCVRALVAGKPVEVRNPASYRPWQHVLEPVHGYLTLAAALVSGAAVREAFNFGPHETERITVAELARIAVSTWEGAGEIKLGDGTGVHEAKALSLSSEKAAHRLGWRPVLSSREAVTWTMDWYRAWALRASGAPGQRMLGRSLDQLHAYRDRFAKAAADQA